LSVRRPKAVPKLSSKGRKISDLGEVVRTRAEAEAAMADAARSNARLREAIDILPQGIVFLDPDGRYILWNKKYAEIYSKSADLFEEGAMLRDTLKVGVERGDYPEAVGREDVRRQSGADDRLLPGQ
jgi:PAS domain-containing protein